MQCKDCKWWKKGWSEDGECCYDTQKAKRFLHDPACSHFEPREESNEQANPEPVEREVRHGDFGWYGILPRVAMSCESNAKVMAYDHSGFALREAYDARHRWDGNIFDLLDKAGFTGHIIAVTAEEWDWLLMHNAEGTLIAKDIVDRNK